MENITDRSFPPSCDIHFQGVNLSGLLVALASANAGLKVAISVNDPIDLSFRPELISLYPLSPLNYFSSQSVFQLLTKIGSFFPTLVYPLRILTLQEGRKFNARALSFTDNLLKRDRDEASFPISFSNYPQYHALEKSFQNAALIHEFRFDRNMMVFYLLKECTKQGITIVKRELESKAHIQVNCLDNSLVSDSIELNSEGFSFKNSIRIINNSFETLIQKLDQKLLLRFLFHKTVNQSAFIEKTLKNLNTLGIKFPDELSAHLTNIWTSSLKKEAPHEPDIIIIKDTPFTLLEDECNSALHKISKSLNRNCSFSKWLQPIKPINLNGDHFRSIQSLCDEKFDLAKQTGIEYSQFCYYFFRYSEIIDDLIELAYSSINENRDNPNNNWKIAENKFKIF